MPLSFRSANVELYCLECRARYRPEPLLYKCRRCGSLLEAKVEPVEPVVFSGKGVWRYSSLLPTPMAGSEPVTLLEGQTPLIKAKRIAPRVEAYIKLEGSNPTGSFKDRGMAVAVTLGKAWGFRSAIAASTGNTAASAAAYTARAGMKCLVILPRGKVAPGKLFQALLHGAIVAEIEEGFDEAVRVAERAAWELRLYPLNSFNPWRLEGQKTIAYELFEQLGEEPDAVVVPVGNGGNIFAIWKGFAELKDLGLISNVPRMIGVQAEGASPLVKAWREGSDPVVEEPSTIATAIRIGRPVNYKRVLRAVRESRGALVSVADSMILEAQKALAAEEGIGVEPASAAPLAAYEMLVNEGVIDRGEKVVFVATGHALKDPSVPLHYRIHRVASIRDLARLLE